MNLPFSLPVWRTRLSRALIGVFVVGTSVVPTGQMAASAAPGPAATDITGNWKMISDSCFSPAEAATIGDWGVTVSWLSEATGTFLFTLRYRSVTEATDGTLSGNSVQIGVGTTVVYKGTSAPFSFGGLVMALKDLLCGGQVVFAKGLTITVDWSMPPASRRR